MNVSIVVRSKNALGLRERTAPLASRAETIPFLTREEFAEQYGANCADMAAVRHFVTKHGLCVVNESQARRTVVVSGTVEALCSAFGTSTESLRANHFAAAANRVKLPRELEGVVEAILGLDTRAIAAPRDV